MIGRERRDVRATGPVVNMSRLSSTTLHIGDPAPPLALLAVDDLPVRLADVLQDSAVLLAFAPGSWSPNTRRQIRDLSAAYERFREAGVGVLVVVTQDAASLKRRLPPQTLPFPVLADERREAARDFGVYRAISLDGLSVTRPAAFLIDRSGSIRFVYVGERDADVPETETLLRLASWLIGLPAPEAAEAASGASAEELSFEESATAMLTPVAPPLDGHDEAGQALPEAEAPLTTPEEPRAATDPDAEQT